MVTWLQLKKPKYDENGKYVEHNRFDTHGNYIGTEIKIDYTAKDEYFSKEAYKEKLFADLGITDNPKAETLYQLIKSQFDDADNFEYHMEEFSELIT